MEALLLLLAYLVLGKLSLISKLCSQRDLQGVKTFAVKIAVPFLIFRSLVEAEVSLLNAYLPVVFGFLLSSSFFLGISIFASKMLPWSIEDKNAAYFSIIQGNHAYLAIAILGQLLGEDSLVLIVFYITAFWPVFILSGYGYIAWQAGEKFSLITLLSKLWQHGGMILSCIGFAIAIRISSLEIPHVVSQFINPLASLAVPLILVLVGAELKISRQWSEIFRVLPLSLARLFLGVPVGFLTVIILTCFFSLNDLTARVIFLQSSMPTAFMTLLFTDSLPINKSLLSTSITTGTIMAFGLVPLWNHFFSSIW